MGLSLVPCYYLDLSSALLRILWRREEKKAHLKQLPDQGDRYDSGRAAHAGQVVGDDISAHPELVDHHSRQ